MRLPLVFSIAFTFIFCNILNSQTITGTWKTIDDNTGKERSWVEITENNGVFSGKITKLLDPDSDQNAVCDECEGDKKNKPILGLEILWDMTAEDDYWSNGRILDPESGSTYKCNISLNNIDELKLRGYIGFPALGRTQTWYRVK